MKTIYGVNSATPINKKLKNGYTLYDWVMRQKGFPAFCMRTIGNDNGLSENEIEFLRNNDCKIGLVLSDFSENQLSSSNGTQDALLAVQEAKKIGVPQNNNIAIFAEVNPNWSINHNWMISFANTLWINGYVAGFIANTDSSKNFNFDRQCSHFVQATNEYNQFDTVYCSTEPKLDSFNGHWMPYCPSAMDPKDIHLWESSNTYFDNIKIGDVYAQDEKVLENMW